MFANAKLVFLLAIFLLFHDAAIGRVSAHIQSNYAYKVTSKNGREAYLFGSNHSSFSNAPTQLGQCVKSLLRSSKAVYLEADPLSVKMLAESIPKTIPMLLVLKYMDTDTRNLVDRLIGLRLMGKELPQMDALETLSALNSMIENHRQVLGFVDLGLDAEVLLASRFLNIEVKYVETPEEQMNFFAKMPASEYAKAIKYSAELVENPDKAVGYWRDLLAANVAAAKGDEIKLLELLSREELFSYNKYTVLDRNESQANKIADFLRDGVDSPLFIAIGAAHLVGKEGVAQRLKSNEFLVERICE